MGLPKSTWYYWENRRVTDEEKYGQVKKDLLKVARDDPAYGYRRATTELKEEYGHSIGKNVILRLMRDAQLQTIRKVKKPKPSVVREVLTRLGDRMNLVVQLENIDLLQVAYTDFTELEYSQGNKKAYLMPIIGHRSKVALGWVVGKSANTRLALEALEMAERNIKKWGFSTEELIIHHDQDPVYTGYGWLGMVLLQLQAQVSYALQGAKDNPQMEAFNGRFKTENKSLIWEAPDLDRLKKVVDEQMVYYNTRRRHSSIGNIAPLTYLKNSR